MNREQHMQAAGHATIDAMAAEAKLESMHKELESLHLKDTEPLLIDAHREQMHTQLDVFMDALSRQKKHLRSAMLARW